MIALGIVAGMGYLIIEGKKEAGLTFDQANALFLFIFFAAVVGGKLFLFLEDPPGYIQDPARLLTGRGFVFYGSFLLAIPTMWWFFRKHKLPGYRMLDVMAITACFVHLFGRIGCFMLCRTPDHSVISHAIIGGRVHSSSHALTFLPEEQTPILWSIVFKLLNVVRGRPLHS
jgi:hypothetical protein